MLKVQWTFVSTDRSGTEKLKVQWTFVSADRSGMEIRTRTSLAGRRQVRDGAHNVRWTLALHRPKRSEDTNPYESGRTRLNKKRYPLGYLFYLRRARDGTRTRDPDLGKVVLHQLSHSRIKSAIHKHMDTILYERGFVNRKTAKSQKKFKLYMLLTQ